MNLLTTIFFLLIGIRLLVAMINWLARSYLPRKNLIQQPDISVLIPARNEQTNIKKLLGSITQFKNQPREILVYDDHSTDATADVVETFMQKFKNVKLIRGQNLPEGWLGKNHACHNLARHSSGRMLLFLDADVQVGENLFARASTFLEQKHLDLLSIFPKQKMISFGEKLSIPLMNWILLSLLPLPLIRLSKNPAFAAANGQFMMFRAESYKKLWPHEQLKKHKVEDIAISQFYKKRGLKTATLLGDEDIQCRMYTSLSDSINGFSKNVFHFFGDNKFVTIGFGLLTTIAPLFILGHNGIVLGMVYILAIVLIRIFISLASKQNVLSNIALLIPQQLVFLSIIVKALATHHKKELIWKDRNILQL